MRHDQGAGSVLAIAVVGASAGACLAVAAALGLLVERAAAQAAADAGALAGAVHARAAYARSVPDAGGACLVAREAVARSGATATRCVAGPGARVQVTASRGRAAAVAVAAPAFDG